MRIDLTVIGESEIAKVVEAGLRHYDKIGPGEYVSGISIKKCDDAANYGGDTPSKTWHEITIHVEGET